MRGGQFKLTHGRGILNGRRNTRLPRQGTAGRIAPNEQEARREGAMTSAGRFLAPLVLAMLAGDIAAAEDSSATFPNRPIRMIVPFPAGGPSDIVARLIGQKMSEDWGQPVVIDNRPGGNTIIGAQAAAKAEPDGYTLFMAINSTLVMNQYLLQEPALRPARGFRADHADGEDHIGAGSSRGGRTRHGQGTDRESEGAAGQTQLRRRHDHRPTDGPSIPQGGGPRHRLCALQGHP